MVGNWRRAGQMVRQVLLHKYRQVWSMSLPEYWIYIHPRAGTTSLANGTHLHQLPTQIQDKTSILRPNPYTKPAQLNIRYNRNFHTTLRLAGKVPGRSIYDMLGHYLCPRPEVHKTGPRCHQGYEQHLNDRNTYEITIEKSMK